MSITVQLMSGQTYTLDIFDGYRIVNSKNEIATILKVNRDLVTISCRNEDGEFEIIDNMDYAQDGEHYHAFIDEEEDPPEYYMRFEQSDIDFEKILICDEDEKEVSHIKNGSTIHVQLSESGWEFIRNVLRENRDGVVYDSEDEYDDRDNDRYNRLSKREVVYRFITYLNIVRGQFDIDIDEDEEDDEDDEDEDEDEE
jgi:hypothetical protein